MIWWLAIAIWACLSAGFYLALSRDLFRLVLGLAILGSGANLLLFAAGRIYTATPAVIPVGEASLNAGANPLPQALVLTAIVIGFSLVCFCLVLLLRLVQSLRSDDTSHYRAAEPLPTDPIKPPYPTADTGGYPGART
jgi:multicomponent Na+:H+ antiporter subunit C